MKRHQTNPNRWDILQNNSFFFFFHSSKAVTKDKDRLRNYSVLKEAKEMQLNQWDPGLDPSPEKGHL